MLSGHTPAVKSVVNFNALAPHAYAPRSQAITPPAPHRSPLEQQAQRTFASGRADASAPLCAGC